MDFYIHIIRSSKVSNDAAVDTKAAIGRHVIRSVSRKIYDRINKIHILDILYLLQRCCSLFRQVT
jgi:hypothetical protein